MEELSLQDKLNEYIMMSLRTKWGVDLADLQNNFGSVVVATFLSFFLSQKKKGEEKKNFTKTNGKKKKELNEWLFDRIAEYQGVPGLTVEPFVLGQSFENRTIYGKKK